MIIKYILLALSASLDALSLGITYGIKQTVIPKIGNIIIFSIVLVCSFLSMIAGHFLSLMFSPDFSVLIGSSLLIILGIYNIYKEFSVNSSLKNFDIDNSNCIDYKEATAISLTVAVDASCVSMGCGIIGYISFVLPVFMAIFHTLFVNVGNSISKKIIQQLNVPSRILSIVSGVLLILIGIFRLI